jgi:hypothetical protein
MMNADAVQSSDLTAMKSFKSLQGTLRSLCLDCGSALVYTAASATTDMNCAKLQRYVLSCLYGATLPLSEEVRLEDGITSAVIPHGLDSHELIALATGINASDVLAHYNGDFLVARITSTGSDSPEGEASSMQIAETSVLLENEQDWLGRLKKFVALAEATSSSSSTTGEFSTAGATVKIERSASGTGLSSAATTSTATGEADSVAPAKPSAAQSRRRGSVQASNAGGQDPTDFFKNLLGDKSAKS